MKVNKDILSEGAIGNYFKDTCTERGYKIVKLNPTLTIGIPDRMILTLSGVTIYVELKSEGKSRSPMQERWGEWLIRAGHLYLVIDKISPEIHYVIEEMFNLIDKKAVFGAIPKDVVDALIALNEMYGTPISIRQIKRSIKNT